MVVSKDCSILGGGGAMVLGPVVDLWTLLGRSGPGELSLEYPDRSGRG